MKDLSNLLGKMISDPMQYFTQDTTVLGEEENEKTYAICAVPAPKLPPFLKKIIEKYLDEKLFSFKNENGEWLWLERIK